MDQPIESVEQLEKLDAEKLLKLEMLKTFWGVRPDTVLYYTPKVFKESLTKKDWPVFKFRAMTASDYENFHDAFYEEGKLVRQNEALHLVICKHVIGWSNYKDIEGAPIDFFLENGILSDKCFSLLSPSMKWHLFRAILDSSHLSKEEIDGIKF